MAIESRGQMTAEQVEIYRRAIAPLQESLAAAKAARQAVFNWLKREVAPPEQPSHSETNLGSA